ncbi:MAG: EVE domain-containing protein [Candidatus Melainabacteria bacterium]
MAKQYWMVKSEPGEFSFDDLVRDGSTRWDGVRNYQARNNLNAMSPGDALLVYHSVSDKQVVGIAEVSGKPYPDPTDNPEGRWVVVDVIPKRKLKKPVDLATIKADKALANLPLIKQSRLSVIPLTKAQFDYLVKLGG